MNIETPIYQSVCPSDPLKGGEAIDPRVLAPKDFYARVAELGVSHEVARRWASAVIGRGERSAETVMRESHLAKRFSHLIADLSSLTLQQHLTSRRDGFEKLLFKTADGMSIETVIIPLHKEGAVSLCLSSQVGCVMGCSF